ncbi:PTS mannose transporter subunit IIAB [Lactobacillus nasalidis]|uniref:PTS mannose transporter subunit IIAB n=1 Tax=Lactobacillus nasalidis TaxID=2797258 RepID=A0ABQ3W6F9_9LACO|nr:fructose PTS transporter subunit IIA [Lactobacillus nasalidis]GHV98067.1 PTS mannose transporter subunit IIAB [Lactobacillus nasalidis]GHV99706.1 PTS mannose transporter subunit IIAB [Lactobacillus nasalidis]GHW02138.1 PTS mannose transporter subunit IIAB [Lactobacillus nasalidis]
MKFDEYSVLVDVDIKNKLDLLKYISEYATKIGIASDALKLNESFREREQEFSTGLEDGFSIPHAKTSVVKEVGIIYVRLKNAIEWETYDDQPVTDVFALMVPPENAGTTHLKMLAKLSTALLEDSFKEKLRTLTEPKQIANYISKEIEVEKI